MKYIVVLGDGMADYPVPELGNKTPLQAAHKPLIDELAQKAEMGLVKTVPEGVKPGSDVANLGVLGYDPLTNYTGRSPLEAVSIGIEMSDTDVALRCNLVTLSDEEDFAQKTMLDYCADEITTEEAGQLIAAVNKHFKTDIFEYFTGVSYRHCLLRKHGQTGNDLTPPHDITGRKITEYLPKGEAAGPLLEMTQASYVFLKDHPVNQERIARGLNPANSIWLWGEGTKPALPLFADKYNLQGAVISAVDLLKGIAICAGMDSIDVPGATGNIHTNFVGKTKAGLQALESGKDFVYLHFEAPDECGHRNEIENKKRSIELIDEKVFGTLLKGLEKYEDYRILFLPDHPTPLSLRTHTSEPVPYLIYQKSKSKDSAAKGYDEFQAKETGLFFYSGADLMDHFIRDI